MVARLRPKVHWLVAGVVRAPLQMKRYVLQTFGCQMNVHDSDRIADVLSRHGYSITDEPTLADALVINSCSVREKAEHKLVSLVGALRLLKEQRPDLVIAVAGCMAQHAGRALLRRVPLVDVLIGPDNIAELPGLLDAARRGAGPQVRTELDLAAPQFLCAPTDGLRAGASAFVTVMKGCDERCSFCIVPYTRGSERYRPARDIVAEVRALVAAGVREIVLLGQTVNSWFEPGTVRRRGSSQFAELLRRIAHEVPELLRLRYTSPHPRHLTSSLIEAHATLDVLPWHVHLPVQSGSDRVLKRMIRRYRRDTFIERARALCAARSGFTLSTDVIVGFPGETEQDFQQTLSLVREVGFVSAFAFKYSPRPHTSALALADDVPEAVKDERLQRVLALVEKQQQAHLRSLVGTRTQVLIEGPGRGDSTRFKGRSHRHEIVHVAAQAPSGGLVGRLLEVEICQAHRHSVSAMACDAREGLRQAAARARRHDATRRGGSLHLPVFSA